MYHKAGPSSLFYCLGAEEDGGDVCVEKTVERRRVRVRDFGTLDS